MTTPAKFWDKTAPKYAKDPIADPAAYQYTLGRTMSYLRPEHRALEIGCGTGSTALELAPHLQHLTATDISPAMIGIAKAKEGAAAIDFRALSAEDAVQLPGPFDVVLAHNLLHLVDHMEKVIAGIAQRLPQGGIFISKTPCLSDPAFGPKRFPIRAIIPVLQLLGKAPAVRFLKTGELEQAVTSAGFEIIEAGNFPAVSRYIVARKR